MIRWIFKSIMIEKEQIGNVSYVSLESIFDPTSHMYTFEFKIEHSYIHPTPFARLRVHVKRNAIFRC